MATTTTPAYRFIGIWQLSAWFGGPATKPISMVVLDTTDNHLHPISHKYNQQNPNLAPELFNFYAYSADGGKSVVLQSQANGMYLKLSPIQISDPGGTPPTGHWVTATAPNSADSLLMIPSPYQGHQIFQSPDKANILYWLSFVDYVRDVRDVENTWLQFDAGNIAQGYTALTLGYANLDTAVQTLSQIRQGQLSSKNLTWADLTEIDLSNVKFSGYDLSHTRLISTNLTAAVFDKANFTDATFGHTILKGTTLSGANFTRCNLLTAVYDNTTIIVSTLSQPTIFTSATLPFALIGHNWQWLELRSAAIPDLPHPLSSASAPLQATGVRLSGLNQNNLRGLAMENAVLDNATLDNLDLSNTDLTSASMIGASLHNTNLTNATLKGAKLTGAQLGSLSQQFTLAMSYESALEAGQVSPFTSVFALNGVKLSSNAYLSTQAAGRVWVLNDVGNQIIYTIRLQSQTSAGQVLVVYTPASAASLVGAYMPDAVLTGANLYGVAASGIQFYGTNARIDGSAILEEAQLNDSNLSNLNLTQAQLLGANLSGALLFNARFNKANLTPSADGVAANLSSANLQGADFTDAQLFGANLSNAAVAVNVPTRAIPQQGGVYLFSLPYTGDTGSLQEYVTELNAAAGQFSLNPDGDQATLQKYVTALETNNLNLLEVAFLKEQPPIKLSSAAQIETMEVGSVWEIVDELTSYTLWTDVDENGETELYAAPILTNLRAAFQQNGRKLRLQASVTIDSKGLLWLLDNDSENPQNTDTGYIRFIIKLNDKVLDVYGSAVRIKRLGDKNQLMFDTETCNITLLGAMNMSGNTICPNGATLSVNRAQSGVDWDVNWLRANTPPAPPACVPTAYNWCPPTQTQPKAVKTDTQNS